MSGPPLGAMVAGDRKEDPMPYDVTIKEEEDELVASIRSRIAPERIGSVIPDAFERLMACVGPIGYGRACPAS